MKNTKILFKYIIAVLSYLMFIPFAMADCCWWMMWWNYWYFGNMFWFIFMIAFWWAVIYLMILAFKYFSKNNEKETPLDILKKRLLKWEISEEEFERLKKKL